jgi:integrase
MAANAYRRSTRYPELFQKAGSSRWWAYLPNPEGGRVLREPTGHADELAAHRWYLDRVRRPVGPTDKDEISLNDALKRRRDERKAVGRAAGTIRSLEVKGRQLCRLLGKDTLLSAVDARAVDDYIAKRLRERVEGRKDFTQRTTIARELSALRGAMKLARRQGYAVRPVEEVLPADFSPQSKPKSRALSIVEIDSLLAKLRVDRAAVVAFIVATGATYPSEMVNLRKGDVDMTTWLVHLRGTKRTTRDRRVPIVDFARDWLRQAMCYFPFASWSNVRKDMYKACEAAGIAPCSPNDLRRSIATLMRARGVEPSLLGAYLGHADSRMAERVYGRLAPEQLAHLLAQRLEATAPKKTRKKRAA